MMTDCYAERVIQGVQAIIQSELDTTYGSGRKCTRNLGGEDPEGLPVESSPWVYMIPRGKEFAGEDEHQVWHLVSMLFSGLVRVGEDRIGSLQTDLLNLECLIEDALFVSNHFFEDGMVTVHPAGMAAYEIGLSHGWVDIPATIRIPRR